MSRQSLTLARNQRDIKKLKEIAHKSDLFDFHSNVVRFNYTLIKDKSCQVKDRIKNSIIFVVLPYLLVESWSRDDSRLPVRTS